MNSPSYVIRVLPADDEHLICGALATLFWEHRPDIGVLDLHMPTMDGIEVAETLRDEEPCPRIVIVTSHGLPGQLRRAMAAGVCGFLPQTVPA